MGEGRKVVLGGRARVERQKAGGKNIERKENLKMEEIHRGERKRDG